ncbi:MAG: GNAT family N-acetyltransferase [Chloroflexi bacterium]|nr:GNAT family N-acetyltransferase [Chloroflexota bacterium]
MNESHERPTLTTARFILRPFVLADAARVQQLAGVREVGEMTGHIPYPYPDGAAEEWIAAQEMEWQHGEAVTFAITQCDTRELIGAIGLTIYRENRRAELGYWLGVPYWNQGYMTEAARAVIRFGFENLNLNRVYASHFVRNPASGRVMQKCGMRYEGTLRQHFVRWGQAEDLVYYGILKSEWIS